MVFGFLTCFVSGGVIFTVNEHLPGFKPFTIPELDNEQIFFDAALTVVTIFDLRTTVLPRVFSAASTETVLPFFTDTPPTTLPDALDALLVPAAFVAVTLNVYAVPFVNPVTVHDRAPLVHEHDLSPGLAVIA